MSNQTSTTTPQRTPGQARVLLAIWALIGVDLVAISLSGVQQTKADDPAGGPSDIHLYRAVVDRVQAGEGYYQSLGTELVSRGFPTKSVFNWRGPCPLFLIGNLPNAALAKALLGMLALAAIVVCLEAMIRNADKRTGLLAGLALTGPFLLCLLGDIYLMPVVWASVLVALSLGCSGLGRNTAAAVAGVAALFCRELAGPFCLLASIRALRKREPTPLLVWCGGYALYAVYLGTHWHQIAVHQPANGHAQAGFWLQFGGLPFVISLAQVNAYLLLLPAWFSAATMGLAWFGLFTWQNDWGRQVSTVTGFYTALFCCIGYQYNQYWGILLTPLLAMGMAKGIAELPQLLRQAFRQPVGADSQSSGLGWTKNGWARQSR